MTRSRRRRGKRTSLRSGLAKLAACVGLLLLGAIGAGAALWFWAGRAGTPGKPLHFDLRAGARIDDVADELQRAGVLDHPRLFVLYARLTRGTSASVSAGAHLLRRGLAPAALLARLTRSAARPSVKVTIPEGYNRFQIAERLEAREVTGEGRFLTASADAALLGSLGVSNADSAEGYLFPATYDLYVDSDPRSVVQTLVGEAVRRFQELSRRHPERLRELGTAFGWEQHQLVTLASIVEKEAADASEHGTIASVFYNRLRDPGFLPRQMLQSDPTAAYGCLVARTAIPSCRDYDGSISPSMLRDAANPYNTYKRPGLPPGPISNPGESAFSAVLDPPSTPFFFFVAGRSKRHVFSRTLSEHERAITTGLAPE